MLLLLGLSACWLTDPEIGSLFLDTGDGDADPITKLPGGTDTDPETTLDTRVDPDTDGDTDGDTDVDPDPFSCVDADLGSGVGEGVASGSTVGAGDDHRPVCYGSSGDGGADLAYRWVAPSAGCWELDTLGTPFDTVLYLRDGCSGAEIACNDDADLLYGLYQSDLGVVLAAGQEVLVVVDGYDAAEEGTFDLDILGVSALPADLSVGAVEGSGVAAGSSAGADDTWDLALCPGSSKDVVIEWTAPRAATWLFDVAGSSYDTVLSIHRPCTANPIACADGYGSGEVIDAWFEAGEVVLIRIAGWNGETGTYQLGITEY